MANAILAAILSFILPGLGQLYEGQDTMKSIIFIIVAIILYALSSYVSAYIGIISLIFSLYAAYDAYRGA